MRADRVEPADAPESVVHESGLRLLATRARSRSELAQRLRGKGYAVEVVERVLDRLTHVGLLDDAAFAQSWVHSRHTYSGKGRRALAAELRTKGVDDHHARAALAQVDEESERERATELVRRKVRGSTSTGDDRDRAAQVRRLVAMLGRRGYDPSMAFSVVQAELAATTADPPDRHS